MWEGGKLTKLVFGQKGLGDTPWSTAKLVLGCDSEDVLFPFNELGDGEVGALQGGGDSDPADLIIFVVLLLEDVIEDLTATIILRRLPVDYNGGVPDLVEGEVYRGTRFICNASE